MTWCFLALVYTNYLINTVSFEMLIRSLHHCLSQLSGLVLLGCATVIQADITLEIETQFTGGNNQLPIQHMVVAVYDGRVATYLKEQPHQVTIYNSNTGRFTAILGQQKMYFHTPVFSLAPEAANNTSVQWRITQNTDSVGGYQCQWYDVKTALEEQKFCLVKEQVLGLSKKDSSTLRSIALAAELAAIEENNRIAQSGGARKPVLPRPPKGFIVLASRSKGSYGEIRAKVSQVKKDIGKSVVLRKEIIPEGYREFKVTESKL